MLGATLASNCNGDSLSSSSAYFFSAPASPTHFLLSSSPAHSAYSSIGTCDLQQADFEFDLAARSMSTAEELFVNGQIRPGFVSTDHAPLPHPEPFHRRTRSVSPTRTPLSLLLSLRRDQIQRKESAASLKLMKPESEAELNPNTASGTTRSDELESVSASMSRSSSSNSFSSTSSNTNSRRWGFIKDFLMLQRSKSEGGLLATAGAGSRPAPRQRNNSCAATGRGRIAHSVSFSPALYKEQQRRSGDKAKTGAKEMRRHMTFLPYKQQGFLFGCLGLSSGRLAKNVGIATVSTRQN